MKKIFYLTSFAILFCLLVVGIRAEKLEIGADFPVAKLSTEIKPADNTIIAFMPSLTDDCEYAGMLTQSFYYYFDQKLAFEGLKKSPATRIFLVVKDKQDETKGTQNIIGGMSVIYDEKGELFSYFGVNQPASKNVSSTVVLLDANNKIAHIDKDYRAQGEHLKPLENKLKDLNGMYQTVNNPPSQQPLKVGDTAPDFRVNEKAMLSDLRGNVVLISFYPAAFSGTLPKSPNLLTSSSTKLFGAPALMSCSTQIVALDTKLKLTSDPKRIVISSSTNALLDRWKAVLGTHNIEYTNDADYSISSNYLSYNPNGYNNRVSVIIDQKGKIAFINNDFKFNDEAVLKSKIDELMKAPSH